MGDIGDTSVGTGGGGGNGGLVDTIIALVTGFSIM
jgi:hypothetical protein